MKQRAKKNEINQTYCLIATGGHLWMRDYFDDLPLLVRRRLRVSPFNLCPACLQTEVMPKLRRQHPTYSHDKLLFAAIEVMEREVRQAGAGPTPSAQPRRRSPRQ
jgi:hypothetical protein